MGPQICQPLPQPPYLGLSTWGQMSLRDPEG